MPPSKRNFRNMRHFLVIIFMSLSVCLALADQQLQVHENKERSGEPIKKSLVLPKNRSLQVHLQPNDDHIMFNHLKVELICLRQQKHIKLDDIKPVCGILSVTYKTSSDSVVLSLTKYNSTSLQGDCTGDVYTQEYSLKGLCSSSSVRSMSPPQTPVPLEDLPSDKSHNSVTN